MTQTHTDRAGLVAAIRAEPGDTTRRLVFADWLDEQDTRRVPCPHCDHPGWKGPNGYACGGCSGTGTIVDDEDARRAEYLRKGVELEQQYPGMVDVSKVGVLGGDHLLEPPLVRFNTIRTRLRTLAASLTPQSWPCPGCRRKHKHNRYPCPVCGGSGDLLRYSIDDGGGTHPPQSFPITYDHCHYPEFITVPTLGELVVRDMTWQRPEKGVGEPGSVRPWQPTPRLTALCGVPPWGVRLAGVVPGDREPNGSPDSGWWSRWVEGVQPREWWIPAPVYDLLEGGERGHAGQHAHNIYFSTPDAARHAIGRALVALGQLS